MRIIKYFKKDACGYLFVLPIILGLVVLFIPSLVQSFLFSISDISTAKGLTLTIKGWEFYEEALFSNKDFVPMVVNAVKDMLINVPVIVFFSIFIATVLNEKFHGRTVARLIFFLPVIIATGIISAADSSNLLINVYESGGKLDSNDVSGMVFGYQQMKVMLENSNLNGTFSSFVLGAIDRIYEILVSSGMQILIFLAGLQSIPVSMYEAAKVEGATSWEVFWKISIPYISPLILVNVFYTIVDSFYSYSNGVVSYIKTTLTNPQTYSLGSAFSWVYLGVALVLLLVMLGIVRKFVVYQD